MEYASRGIANAGLTTGIIGTSLGALASVGGVAGLLGLGGHNASGDPGDRPVTRYEMELYQQINAKNDEITKLEAEKYADAKSDALQAQVTQQAIWTAGATATMGFMGQQIQQLYGITKLVVPNGNVAPGWGPAFVGPLMPPGVQVTPPTDVAGTTTTSTGG